MIYKCNDPRIDHQKITIHFINPTPKINIYEESY